MVQMNGHTKQVKLEMKNKQKEKLQRKQQQQPKKALQQLTKINLYRNRIQPLSENVQQNPEIPYASHKFLQV